MADTYRALCAELALVLAEEYGVEREFTSGEPLVGTGAIELLARVRAALAQPEAEGPTDEEWDALKERLLPQQSEPIPPPSNQ